MLESKTPKKIGLMGTFGYGNLGDAAIQDAMIQHIRIYFPDAVIYGFSLNPEDTKARHGIESFPISRLSWKDGKHKTESNNLLGRFTLRLRSSSNRTVRNLERWLGRIPLEFGLVLDAYRNLGGLDALIVSGGGQLDDYWSGGGPWSHPYTLLKLGLLARLRRVKYDFVSVGAGPIDAILSKVFIRWALSLADYRSYRDQFSKTLIEKIGLSSDDPVYPDLAHSLKIPNIFAQWDATKTRPLIGIGPIGYFKPGCWPEADEARYSEYLSKMASFVAWLIENQYSVVFLVGEAYFDLLAINDLKQILARNGVSSESGQIIETTIQSVEDLICQLSATDMVVASRFHTVLLSQVIEKPVLALSYQAKIDALMADTGQAEYCVPIGKFDLDELKGRFLALEANCGTIRLQVAERTREYQNALDEQYERIFAQL
jgi:polysaccharide pyruvyl transferase WcaK-like protein